MKVSELRIESEETTSARNEPAFLPEYIKRLANSYDLTLLGEDSNMTVEELIKRGTPFWCKLKNTIRFQDVEYCDVNYRLNTITANRAMMTQNTVRPAVRYEYTVH